MPLYLSDILIISSVIIGIMLLIINLLSIIKVPINDYFYVVIPDIITLILYIKYHPVREIHFIEHDFTKNNKCSDKERKRYISKSIDEAYSKMKNNITYITITSNPVFINRINRMNNKSVFVIKNEKIDNLKKYWYLSQVVRIRHKKDRLPDTYYFIAFKKL